MKKQLLLVTALCLCMSAAQTQPSNTALDQVTPFNGNFRPCINMGYHPNWSNEQLANISAGNQMLGLPGIGAKGTRPALYENIFASFGYNLSLYDFQVYQSLGMGDFVGIIGGPPQWNLDFTNYCPGQPSAIYKDLYLPIWDANNGTPYNENNPFAAYLYRVVETYRDYITFWEIWNEPGFDFSQQNGRKQPGEPGNWWDNDPNPCDYQLRAPIEHYVRMLRISWEIIKTLDPDAYVTLGDPGFPSFLDAVLRNTDNPAGGSVTPAYPLKGGAYFDCVSFHAYPHFDYTAFDPVLGIFNRHSDGAADGLVLAKNRFKTVLQSRGFNGTQYPEKEWIVTEYNAPRRAITGEWLEGADMQVNYLLKVLMKAKVDRITQMHVYELFDHTTDPEADEEFDLMGLYGNNTGVVAYNQVMNDQGKAMKTFTDLLYNTTYDPAATTALNLPSGVRGYAFSRTNGEHIYALWAETQTDRSEAASRVYSFPSGLNLGNLVRYDWDFGYSGNAQASPATNIALTARPIFIKENNAPPCALTTSVTNIICNDNNTPSNPSDDLFSFRLTVNGAPPGSTTWTAVIDGQTQTGTYGTAKILNGFPIANGNLNFLVTDANQTDCSKAAGVTVPAPCSNQPSTQYCESKADFPWHEWITEVKTGTLDKVSEKSQYSNFTLNSTALAVGQSHPVTIKSGFSWLNFTEYYRIWIDFNKNNAFEANEIVFEKTFTPTTAGATAATLEGTITIPANAALGTTRMRVSQKRGGYPLPCELIPFGEVEDYTVNISTGTSSCNISATISNIQCQDSGTPTIGGDDTFTFSANVTGSGTGNSGSWSVAVGSTIITGNYGVPKTFGPFPIIGGTLQLNFHDLVDVTCSTVQNVPPPQPCSSGGGAGTYCASQSSFPWHDWITQISLGDLSYTSSKSTYSDFLNQIATVQVGSTNIFQLTTGFSWLGFEEYCRVWIDFDRDGNFETNELVFDVLNPAPQYPTPLLSVQAPIQIPANAVPGVTRMRVVMQRGNTPPSPCGTFEFGETEDYSINITGGGGQTCQLFAQIGNLSCQNNGTSNNPADDVFSFGLTVSGAGTSSGWKTTINGALVTGSYGTPKALSGFSIAGGNLTFTVQDQNDATCTQTLTVVPPPACSNQTGPCSSRSDFPWHDWIAGIKISNVNNASGKSQYSDFTAQNINLVAGNTYPVELMAGFSYFTYPEFWRIWIDFNKNGAFDAAEMVFEKNYPASPNGTYFETFLDQMAIPSGVLPGITKMRISMKRDAYATPCEILPFGEVEDYSVNIASSLRAGQVRAEHFDNPANLTLYPNPAGDLVRLFVGDYLDSSMDITFYSTLGVAVKALHVKKIAEPFIEIDLMDLSNGQYFVHIISDKFRPVGKKLAVARNY